MKFNLFFDDKNRNYITIDTLKCNNCNKIISDLAFFFLFAMKNKATSSILCYNCRKKVSLPFDIKSVFTVIVTDRLPSGVRPIVLVLPEIRSAKLASVFEVASTNFSDYVNADTKDSVTNDLTILSTKNKITNLPINDKAFKAKELYYKKDKEDLEQD